jgi:hypothetical protein
MYSTIQNKPSPPSAHLPTGKSLRLRRTKSSTKNEALVNRRATRAVSSIPADVQACVDKGIETIQYSKQIGPDLCQSKTSPLLEMQDSNRL